MEHGIVNSQDYWVVDNHDILILENLARLEQTIKLEIFYVTFFFLLIPPYFYNIKHQN